MFVFNRKKSRHSAITGIQKMEKWETVTCPTCKGKKTFLKFQCFTCKGWGTIEIPLKEKKRFFKFKK